MAGETKIIACSVCGEMFEASKFASAKNAKCPKCKKVTKNVSTDNNPKIGQVICSDDGHLEVHDYMNSKDNKQPTLCPSNIIKDIDSGAIVIDDANYEQWRSVIALIGGKLDSITPKGLIEPLRTVSDEGTENMCEDYKITLKRNRSEIEAQLLNKETGEIIERIPVEWEKAHNNIGYLSVSKISAHLQCPHKFYQSYANRDVEKDDGNIFTWFGSILHEVMENTSRAYWENSITLDPIIEYNRAWAKRQLTDMGMYREGQRLIEDYFTRHPIGSDQFRPVMYGSQLSVELEWRGQLGIIPQFGLQFDYIGISPDGKTGIIKDYKTNRVPFSKDELENSLQLTIYEIVARKLFPDVENWITGYELFFHGWQQCPKRTQQDLDMMLEYVNNIYTQIVADTMFPARLNKFCGYCTYRSECEEYSKYIRNTKRMIDLMQTDKTNIDEIATYYEQICVIEKVIKQRKDELAGIMKKFTEENAIQGKPAIAGGNEYYLQAQSRPTYNYYSAKQVMTVMGLSSELDGCVTINKTKLDKVIAQHPEIQLEMAKCLEQGFSAPYLNKRKAR